MLGQVRIEAALQASGIHASLSARDTRCFSPMPASLSFNFRSEAVKYLAAALFLVRLPCAGATNAGHPASTLPRYVVGPPNRDRVNRGLSFRELFEKPDEWKETRALTDALLYADWSFREFTDDELRSWFAQMQRWNIKLELEVGGVKEWGGATGESTFKAQKPMWDRLQRLGGNIYSIVMDEPLCCVRQSLHRTDEYAVEQTADFIALVRANYPNLIIGEAEPYPSIPVYDHMRWIYALQSRLAARHIKGVEFYRMDVNWIVFDIRNQGSWNEVKQIQKYCKSSNLPFSLIYWAPGYDYMEKLGLADDSTWRTGVMAQGYAYASVNGVPDQYVLEDWEDCPSHTVPETADYSFTRSALDFGRKFVKPIK